MTELRLSIDLDKLPSDRRWRVEMAHILRSLATVADQLDAGWYSTVNDLPTVSDSKGEFVGEWTVIPDQGSP